MNKTLNKNMIAFLFAPLLFLLIIYPLVALLTNLEVPGISATLNDKLFWDSVKNTLLAALVAASLCVVLSIGFGYCHMFMRNSLLYRIANLMNDLPIALPHTVAGLALLLAFGRTNFGFAGPTGLAFTLVAVVLAMFFVSYPLAARAVASGVDQMDLESIAVARTLGDTPTKAFLRIALPSLREALFSGFVLSFARSLSEFAAVIMFGGNVPGSTQVLASYVFTKVEEGEVAMAVTASGFCIILSLILVALVGLGRRRRA
jgi:molybdate transport system permease protein